ncbi:MAG: pentapeptide repeat-containing protein, partial [Pseudanabaena sp.]
MAYAVSSCVVGFCHITTANWMLLLNRGLKMSIMARVLFSGFFTAIAIALPLAALADPSSDRIQSANRQRLIETNRCQGCNLQNTDLNGLKLIGADLNKANLQGANLRSVDLRGANLQGANLTYTDLSYADLRLANFGQANLTGANLSNAYLLEASFRQSILQEANLTDSYADGNVDVFTSVR